MTASAREELRAKLLSRIPRWYSPWSHLAFPSVVGFALVAGAIASIRGLRPWELAFVPIFYALGNAVEWRAHRGLLHRRTRFFGVLYQRHTPQHHAIYVMDDMAIRSVREFKLVLLPAYGVLAIFVLTMPVTVLLALAGLRNIAALWVATSVGYVVTYEWLHLSYHLPPDGPIGRLWIVRLLRRHHALHHAPALMQRWNFNVTVPLWDWVRGTTYRGQAAVRPAANSFDSRTRVG